MAAILPLMLVGFETSRINVTGGGCIIVFFIPICFGVGEQATQALLLAVILVIILVAVILLFNTWILKVQNKYKASKLRHFKRAKPVNPIINL
jgi:uncharacterized membrane protein